MESLTKGYFRKQYNNLNLPYQDTIRTEITITGVDSPEENLNLFHIFCFHQFGKLSEICGLSTEET